MRLFGLLKSKKNNQTEKDPFEFDKALFDQFYHDLKNNKLPKVSKPRRSEIEKYTQRKTERLAKRKPSTDSTIEDLWSENNSIPVEIDIWVDKVYEHYFADLKPMRGLIHWCEGARRALYKYKGYTWHTISELNPGTYLD